MQSLLRRLKYYGIGFLFGLLFVIFFFKNRGCTWLPSNRVKNSVQERILVLPANQEKALELRGITKTDLLQIIEKGDVDFSESLKHSDPKVYLFEGATHKGQQVKLFMTLPSESFVSEIHVKESHISKVRNTTSGLGKLISFPKDRQLIYLDSTTQMDQRKKELGIKDGTQLLKWMKVSGRIDFAKTNFRLKPKAEQAVLVENKKGEELLLKAVWYKEKINVISIDFADSSSKD